MARWTKWVLLLTVLAVGAYILFVDWPRRQAAVALRQAIAELDESDPDWRLEQVEAKRRPVTEAENGALMVLAAKAALTRGNLPSKAFDELENTPPPVRLSDTVAKTLRAELQAEKAAVAVARKLIDYPTGRFAFRYTPGFVGTPMDDQHHTRTIGALLWMDVCNALHEGQIEQAWRSTRAVLNVGRSLGDEPLFVSFGCRVALQSRTVECVERILAHTTIGEVDLAAMQESLTVERREPMFLISLRGERAGMHEMFEHLDKNSLPIAVAIDKLLPIRSREAKWSDYVTDMNARNALLRSHASILRSHTKMLQIAAEPDFAKYDRLRDLVDEIDTPQIDGHNLGQSLGYSAAQIAAAEQRADTLLHCCIAGIAAERFRLKCLRWPDSLNELILEKLLPAVPEDLFDGKPIRFRKAADGIVIYSNNRDGNYQGDALDRLEDFGDRVRLEFRLWDPAHRRQPPLPPRKPPENP